MSPEETDPMSVRVDLHLHTTASDGRWSPEQLIDRLRQKGVGLFAVTDHDSLGSLAETAKRVRGTGLKFLPGVELSAHLDGQVYHMLGYGFHPDDPALVEFVAANNALLNDTNDEIMSRLAGAGWPISLDEYASYSWDRHRGGWKSLNYLLDHGVCQDVLDYNRLLGEITHPEPGYPSPDQVSAVVQKASGTVILAHPGAYFRNHLDVQRLDQLVEMGIQGLECYTVHHDKACTECFLDYCRDRNLLVTGGSDCHGGLVGRSLGEPPVYVSELRLDGLMERLWA
jgi:predicted metal-dependent phosphoesterase TrpH